MAARHPAGLGNEKHTWGCCFGVMFGRRVDQKKRAFETKLKGFSWNWRRIRSSNHWNVKLVLIFHEAQLVGGFLFWVFPLFPKGGCGCAQIWEIWQTEWSSKINHSYIAMIPSLKKPNKNRLPFTINRLPCEPSSPLRSCNFFCTLCELSRSRLSNGN